MYQSLFTSLRYVGLSPWLQWETCVELLKDRHLQQLSVGLRLLMEERDRCLDAPRSLGRLGAPADWLPGVRLANMTLIELGKVLLSARPTQYLGRQLQLQPQSREAPTGPELSSPNAR